MSANRKNRFVLLFVLLCMMLVLPVYANAGDMSSLAITFENMPDAVFYGTLLAEKLPREVADYTTDAAVPEWCEEDMIPIYEAICRYEDADGFFYWEYSWDNIFPCSESGKLVLNYPRLDTFKLLLYFPETDTYAVSGVLERYALNASYVLGFDGVMPEDGEPLDVRVDYHLPSGLGGLLVRMVLTILLELGVAWLFRYRTKPLVYRIIAVNIITQILLNIALVGISFKLGVFAAFIAYFLLEIPVFLIESIAYAIMLPDRRGGTWWKAVLYAIAANFVSFIVGYRLSLRFPIVF